MNYDELKQKFKLKCDTQQEDAIKTISGPILLLAVPGSGKTTVIINRIGYLIYCCNIKPESILTLTYNKAAVNNMKTRFISTFGKEYEELVKFSTIHSFCYSVIKECAKKYNKSEKDIFAINDNPGKTISRLCVDLFNIYLSDTEINEILQRITYCKNMCFTEDKIKKENIPNIDFYNLYINYEKKNRYDRKMDYDDLLKQALHIFENYEDILIMFQNKYDYINIDEAQDTSFIQHKIIKLLADKKKNIFMVGDEDQSIYGFRAAYPKALLDFEKTYPRAKVLYLETNYRSTQNIVSAANTFIKQNRNRKDKNMVAFSGLLGAEIQNTVVEFDFQQYDYILQQIIKNDKQIAIVYRNNDSAIPLIHNLIRRNVAFDCSTENSGFFEHFVIKDICLFIEFSKNISDTTLFSELYYKMGCYISKEMFQEVCLHIKSDESVFDTLFRLNNSENFSKKLRHIKNGFLKLEKSNTFEAIDIILNDIKYNDYLNSRKKEGYSEEGIRQKIYTLKIISRSIKSPYELGNELNIIKKHIDSEKNNHNSAKCVLSTIHASKGREFEKVIIIDALEGILPAPNTLKSSKDNDEYEEELRLFYVAITRAKKELEILSAKKIFGFHCTVSRFVNSLFHTIKKRNKPAHNTNDKIIRHKSSLIPGKYNRQENASKRIISNKNELKSGMWITHKKFGDGKIERIDNKNIIINFKRYPRKNLDLETCLKEMLLMFLNNHN